MTEEKSNPKFKEMLHKIYYLERKIKNLESILGYGTCPYCESEITREGIQNKLDPIKIELVQNQPIFDGLFKEEKELNERNRIKRLEESHQFDKLCKELKPKLMPKIRKAGKLAMLDDDRSISLPQLSEEEKKAWDWLMDYYMDDDGIKQDWNTDKRLFFYLYQK